MRNILVAAVVALGACGSDDNTNKHTNDGRTTFEIEVSNVSPQKRYFASGMFNTPVGAAEPGPLLPGGAYEFAFWAPPGARLSLATMFVQSNDLFYAPDPMGIPLYDSAGMALSGDVTKMIKLWDVGSEINQEPGIGADQAPRQAAPNSGSADSDNTVRLAGSTNKLPSISEVLAVTIEAMGNGAFKARIENTSTNMTLMTSTNEELPVPLAPGVWVVHTDGSPLFDEGKSDRGEGLVPLAEDGSPAGLAEALAARSGVTSPLAPGLWVVHDSDSMPLFQDGRTDRGDGLEDLAEDGSPAMLLKSIEQQQGVRSLGAFDTPQDARGAAPALPGQSYRFMVTAAPGAHLSLATMFVQSNDLFYASPDNGIALFDKDDVPISGDITDRFTLWDAGTEKNQAPGAGLDQAPRQAGPNSGASEGGTVRKVDDAFSYPKDDMVLRVMIKPVK